MRLRATISRRLFPQYSTTEEVYNINDKFHIEIICINACIDLTFSMITNEIL